jgi:hypothetical protein
MFVAKAIATHSYDAGKRDFQFLVSWRDAWEEPWDFSGVSQAEDEFVDDTVDAHSAGDEGEGSIGWVGEYEVVCVE